MSAGRRRTTYSMMGRSEEELREITQELKSDDGGIEVGDHVHRLQTYSNCFIGKDLIDWLIKKKYVTKRREGLELGRELAAMNFIQHVTQDESVRDADDAFYIFPPEQASAASRKKSVSAIAKAYMSLDKAVEEEAPPPLPARRGGRKSGASGTDSGSNSPRGKGVNGAVPSLPPRPASRPNSIASTAQLTGSGETSPTLKNSSSAPVLPTDESSKLSPSSGENSPTSGVAKRLSQRSGSGGSSSKSPLVPRSSNGDDVAVAEGVEDDDVTPPPSPDKPTEPTSTTTTTATTKTATPPTDTAAKEPESRDDDDVTPPPSPGGADSETTPVVLDDLTPPPSPPDVGEVDDDVTPPPSPPHVEEGGADSAVPLDDLTPPPSPPAVGEVDDDVTPPPSPPDVVDDDITPPPSPPNVGDDDTAPPLDDVTPPPSPLAPGDDDEGDGMVFVPPPPPVDDDVITVEPMAVINTKKNKPKNSDIVLEPVAVVQRSGDLELKPAGAASDVDTSGDLVFEPAGSNRTSNRTSNRLSSGGGSGGGATSSAADLDFEVVAVPPPPPLDFSALGIGSGDAGSSDANPPESDDVSTSPATQTKPIDVPAKTTETTSSAAKTDSTPPVGSPVGSVLASQERRSSTVYIPPPPPLSDYNAGASSSDGGEPSPRSSIPSDSEGDCDPDVSAQPKSARTTASRDLSSMLSGKGGDAPSRSGSVGAASIPKTDTDNLENQSVTSLRRKSKRTSSLLSTPRTPLVRYARALYDIVAEDSDELECKKGALIVVTQSESSEWWQGSVDGGPEGLFPRAFVEVLKEEDLLRTPRGFAAFAPPEDVKYQRIPEAPGVYVERKGVRNSIRDAFNKDNFQTMSQLRANSYALLRGPMGSGKSASALAYAHSIADEFAVSLFIRGDSLAAAVYALARVGSELDIVADDDTPHGSAVAAVTRLAADPAYQPWLVVVDNAVPDIAYDVLSTCVPRVGGRVLVTSSHTVDELKLPETTAVVNMPVMEVDEATELFRACAGKGVKFSDEDVERLVEPLVDNTLAITLAAAYAQTGSVGVSDVMKISVSETPAHQAVACLVDAVKATEQLLERPDDVIRILYAAALIGGGAPMSPLFLSAWAADHGGGDAVMGAVSVLLGVGLATPAMPGLPGSTLTEFARSRASFVVVETFVVSRAVGDIIVGMLSEEGELSVAIDESAAALEVAMEFDSTDTSSYEDAMALLPSIALLVDRVSQYNLTLGADYGRLRLLAGACARVVVHDARTALTLLTCGSEVSIEESMQSIGDNAYGGDLGIETDYELGMAFGEMGEPSAALIFLTRAADSVADSFVDGTSLAADVYRGVGGVWLAFKEYEKATAAFTCALDAATIANDGDEECPAVAAAYGALSTCALGMGNLVLAVQCATQAREFHIASVGAQSPLTHAFHTRVGHTQAASGDHVAALTAFEAATVAAISAYGDYHPVVAAAHFDVGSSNLANGALGPGLAFFTKAIDVVRVLRGNRHVDMATMCRDCGVVMLKYGHAAGALNYLARALAIATEIAAEGNLVAEICEVVADALVATKEYEEALGTLDRALNTRLDKCNTPSLAVQRLHLRMAEINAELEEMNTAAEHHAVAFAIEKRLFGARSENVYDLGLELGSFYVNAGEYDAAAEFYEGALTAIVELTKGELDVRVAQLLTTLGLVYLKSGDDNASLSTLKKASAIAEAALGKDDQLTQHVAKCIDIALQRVGPSRD